MLVHSGMAMVDAEAWAAIGVILIAPKGPAKQVSTWLSVRGRSRPARWLAN